MKQTLWNDGFIFVAFISILDTLSRLRSSIQTALCVFYYAPHTTYNRRKVGKERRASMNNIKWSDRCAYNAHKTVYNVKNTKEHINCRRKSYRQILKQSRNEKLFYTWKTSQYVNVCVCVCAFVNHCTIQIRLDEYQWMKKKYLFRKKMQKCIHFDHMHSSSHYSSTVQRSNRLGRTESISYVVNLGNGRPFPK